MKYYMFVVETKMFDENHFENGKEKFVVRVTAKSLNEAVVRMNRAYYEEEWTFAYQTNEEEHASTWLD